MTRIQIILMGAVIGGIIGAFIGNHLRYRRIMKLTEKLNTINQDLKRQTENIRKMLKANKTLR